MICPIKWIHGKIAPCSTFSCAVIRVVFSRKCSLSRKFSWFQEKFPWNLNFPWKRTFFPKCLVLWWNWKNIFVFVHIFVVLGKISLKAKISVKMDIFYFPKCLVLWKMWRIFSFFDKIFAEKTNIFAKTIYHKHLPIFAVRENVNNIFLETLVVMPCKKRSGTVQLQPPPPFCPQFS